MCSAIASRSMKFVILLVFLSYLSEECRSQITVKQEKTLSRKKRYLIFPENSNLIITLQSLKELLIQVPKGYRNVIELDVFYKLPSKPYRYYLKTNKIPMYYKHKRDIYDGISNGMDTYGYKGDACVTRMVCETRYLAPFKDSSLFKKLLFMIFANYEDDKYDEMCSKFSNLQCDVSLLTYVLHFIYGD